MKKRAVLSLMMLLVIGTVNVGSGSAAEPDVVSAWEPDEEQATVEIDNEAALPDGVYTPDCFGWSGGSGRVSITCDQVTVLDGKAYATIVFSSSSYVYVKADGSRYYGEDGSFTIPVSLNQNNRILGMTTKMSQAHEIEYQLFVWLEESSEESSAEEEKETKTVFFNEESECDADGAMVPQITGLKAEKKEELPNAAFAAVYRYTNQENRPVTLIEISTTNETVAEGAEPTDGEDTQQETEEMMLLEERLAALYQSDVIRYLIAEEDTELPAGIEKEVVIVRLPVEGIFAPFETAKAQLNALGITDEQIIEAGSWQEPEYRRLVAGGCDLVIVPSEVCAEDARAQLGELADRCTTMKIPMMIDRSEDEADEAAKAEWKQVYGAFLGMQR